MASRYETPTIILFLISLEYYTQKFLLKSPGHYYYLQDHMEVNNFFLSHEEQPVCMVQEGMLQSTGRKHLQRGQLKEQELL